MGELDERDPLCAADVYLTEPVEQETTEAFRHNVTKLLLARWGHIDDSNYSLIIGTAVKDQKHKGQAIAQIRKWAENIQGAWIGSSSWLQRYIAGAISWSDYQKLINNLNRQVKILKFAPAGETAVGRTQRRERGRDYRKALRIHREHIRLGTKQEIEDAEQTLQTVSLTKGVTERELQVLRSRITFLEQFREGIQPSDVTQIQRAEDGEPKQKYYAQMNVEERLKFLAQLWNQDIFVSFLWKFQGVLHFNGCWNDDTVKALYKDKFLYTADLIVQYILTSRNITKACQLLSSNSLIHTSIIVPEDKNTCYAKFREADKDIFDGPTRPGDEGILWVAASRHRVRAPKKRARQAREEDSDDEAEGMAAILRRLRQRAP